MKMKSTKRSLLFSALAMLLSISLLVGSTFAWFTDSVTSANNIIKSGNLDVELEYWNGQKWVDVKGSSDILSGDLWEPGYVDVAYLRLTNAGSLALQYQLGVNIVSETAGVNVAGQSFLLSDYIYFDVATLNVSDSAPFAAYASREDAMLAVSTPDKISAGFNKASSLEAGAAPVYLAMVVYMPTTVGNEANHNGVDVPQIDLGISAFATQYTSELDSYDNQYDDVAIVSGESDLETAIAAGKDIILADDVAVDANNVMTVADGEEILLDLNGHDIIATASQTGGNRALFTVKGEMAVIGEGTISMTFTGANMAWGAMTAPFSVEGGELSLGEGVQVFNLGGTDMAYAVDVNTTLGESVLYVDGATLFSSYIGVRIYNNNNNAKGYVYLNSGAIQGARKGYDIWAQALSAPAENAVVSFAPSYTVITEDLSGKMYYIQDNATFVTPAGLQDALNTASDGDVLVLTSDYTGNLTYRRQENVNVTLNGNGNTINGLFTLEGAATTGSLTIENVDFVAASGANSVIYCGTQYTANGATYNNYVSNVTISNCTFTDPENDLGCAAVRHDGGGKVNWTLDTCTVNSSMHSLLQVSNVNTALVVKDCKVFSKNGINLNYGEVLTMSGCTFDVKGYAVRIGVSGAVVNGNYSITDSDLKSACAESDDAVIVFRGTMSGSTMTLSGNTLTGTRTILGNANVID